VKLPKDKFFKGIRSNSLSGFNAVHFRQENCKEQSYARPKLIIKNYFIIFDGRGTENLL
jgi:hypothetical protein